MDHHSLLRMTLAADSDRPLGQEHLTVAERLALEQMPTERRRFQFVLGRLAARAAVRQFLGPGAHTSLEILAEPGRAPRLSLDGRTDRAAISISHSSRLAVACLWPINSAYLLSAGVDLEHVRPNEVGESAYAFSDRERRLLARLPEAPEILGLAAWTVKESVWKALLASQDIGPDAIDLYALSLEEGYAVVQVRDRLAEKLGAARLDVQTEIIQGPDGRYILSLAQVLA